jgi:membrane glycosyltransferase
MMDDLHIPAVCRRYLDRLALPALLRARVEEGLAQAPGLSDEEAMRRLHGLLAGAANEDEVPAYASAATRARTQIESDKAWCADGQAEDAALRVAPPIARGSMVPLPWGPLNPIARKFCTLVLRQKLPEIEVDAPRMREPVNGGLRRLVLLFLMLGQTVVATYFMSRVLPYQGAKPLEMALLSLFALLFCWVSAGFWTALTGFLILVTGRDRYLVSRGVARYAPIAEEARTAIVMPICNENVARVFAGLRATYESVARTPYLDRFDFYVLSDSSVSDTCADEIAAWSALCRMVDGFGRIFYRRRQRRVRRKSGNIDDFCRRWGRNYRYMIVLDADSVMSGDCLTRMVQAMEIHPDAGIIQTAPRAAGRDTLYARIQQFSTRVYGPLFTAGLHYWQLGESHYWGHNAIIRIKPFMEHCALALLPGKGTFSGEILSHDFIEAALMRRAGWKVWIAYDLDGSYEEMPPNLLDELKRDRRWCQGNLMNFRLFLARGMHSVHRAVFVTGVMAYLSAPLWLLFLILSTGLLAQHTLTPPTYFTEPWQLFPTWPQWHPEKALMLFSATATLLFLPKILSVLLVWKEGAPGFGGPLRLTMSMFIEMIFSMLLAPVRMLFHTHFVVAAFMGWALRWKSPAREDSETTPGEALRHHGFHTLVGLVWGGGIFWLNPTFLPWLLPIVGSLVVAIPVSVYSSKVVHGVRFRQKQLFVIPEEASPPLELCETERHLDASPLPRSFVDAVVDPAFNGVACVSGIRHPRRSLAACSLRDRLIATLLSKGPAAVPDAQKNALLADPVFLSKLHFKVWTSAQAHPEWKKAAGLPFEADRKKSLQAA